VGKNLFDSLRLAAKYDLIDNNSRLTPGQQIRSHGDVLRPVAILVTLFFVVGCEKRCGDAIIVAKEHIAAAAPSEPEANPQAPVRSDADADAAVKGSSPSRDSEEITVDSYVMKPELRDTSHSLTG
jgi:hypothetical protein